jgi:ATP-dependent Clp protease ATP-binding subunit ClpC
MFERFTDRARRVIVEAQHEARALGHNYIGTEHLLLGLIHEGNGLAAKVLESLGIGTAALRERVEEIVDVGYEPRSSSGHIPFTPRAKQVLRLALAEALRLGHNYIGTEHLLLALIQERDGVAGQVLAAAGADLGRVRAEVVRLLAEYQRRQGPVAGGSQGQGADRGEGPGAGGGKGPDAGGGQGQGADGGEGAGTDGGEGPGADGGGDA